jgi:dissimilatory sulfite reductase (desulfoviridin) alpha/beta subunit
VGIVLKYPTIALADKMQRAAEGKNQMDIVVDVVCQCIDYIFDAENTYPASESSKQELVDFINNLGQEQFAKINNFFVTMPKLKHTIHWECEKCGTKDHITLEGMANFFG